MRFGIELNVLYIKDMLLQVQEVKLESIFKNGVFSIVLGRLKSTGSNARPCRGQPGRAVASVQLPPLFPHSPRTRQPGTRVQSVVHRESGRVITANSIHLTIRFTNSIHFRRWVIKARVLTFHVVERKVSRRGFRSYTYKPTHTVHMYAMSMQTLLLPLNQTI